MRTRGRDRPGSTSSFVLARLPSSPRRWQTVRAAMCEWQSAQTAARNIFRPTALADGSPAARRSPSGLIPTEGKRQRGAGDEPRGSRSSRRHVRTAGREARTQSPGMTRPPSASRAARGVRRLRHGGAVRDRARTTTFNGIRLAACHRGGDGALPGPPSSASSMASPVQSRRRPDRLQAHQPTPPSRARRLARPLARAREQGQDYGLQAVLCMWRYRELS